MSPADIAAVQRGMAERADSIPTLATINVPTLVIAGEDDSVPLSELQLIHQGITGSQFRVIAKAGHYAAMEQPDGIWPVIADFFRRTVAQLRLPNRDELRLFFRRLAVHHGRPAGAVFRHLVLVSVRSSAKRLSWYSGL